MNYQKIAAGLLTALEVQQDEGDEGLAPHAHVLGMHPAIGRPVPPRATVFLEVDEAADLSTLAPTGVVVNQSSGAIRTAFVRLIIILMRKWWW